MPIFPCLADSMIIRDLYLVSVMATPTEANPILVVDADAVLPLPITVNHYDPV